MSDEHESARPGLNRSPWLRAQPETVYYIDPSGELSQVISRFRRPNGIILSPNGQTLYLAVEAETKIMAYDIGPDGRLLNERQFALTAPRAQRSEVCN
jgi:sugar lactone lactonase YvrE